jgi:hypothetical protein
MELSEISNTGIWIWAEIKVMLRAVLGEALF